MQKIQNIRTMLQIAVDLHNWESEHMNEMETLSGRFIFLNLVSYFCKNKQEVQDVSPLKSIYRTEKICEKSIRNKLKEFNSNGLIQFVPLKSDARSKCAVPTNQMIKRLMLYSEQINRIVKNHVYLVEIEKHTSAQFPAKKALNQQHTDLKINLEKYITHELAKKLTSADHELTAIETFALQSFVI